MIEEFIPKSFNDFELNYIQAVNNICFTPREIDVISCLIHGRTVKTIATYLAISAKTVETHIWNIMGKLKCNSQESIRDFIEKTNEIAFIRNHYAKIRLQTDFEKCLSEIKNNDSQIVRKYTIIFDDNSKNIVSLIHKLKKHLSICGLDLSVKYQNSNKAFNNNFNKYDQIIHIITLKKLSEIKQYHSNLIFLIKEEEDKNLNQKNLGVNYLNLFSYKSYFFLLFDILKKIIPTARLDSTVHQFQQYYDKFLEGQLVTSEPITYTKNELKKRKGYWNTHTFKVTKWIAQQRWVMLMLLVACVISVASYVATNTQEYKNSTNILNSWNLPFPNLYFTGRDNELKAITEKFKEGKQKNQPITVVVCTGLGGIGKTEIAKGFIHKTQKDYSVRVWFSAEKLDQLLENYSLLGQKLGITNSNSSAEEIITSIKNWFEAHQNCLIVYDNAENFDSLVNFMPHQGGGDILITSRHRHWPNSIEIRAMTDEDASSFVKRILNYPQGLTDIELLISRLKNLPLAISQAGAYILKNGKTIKDYLLEYDREEQRLLSENSNLPGLYHEPPSITWNINIHMIKEESKLAYEIINYLVYLHSDEIDRGYLINVLPKKSGKKISKFNYDKAIQVLLSYSMIQYNQNKNTLNIHRLVQTIMWYKQFSEGSRKKWLSQVLNVLIKDREANLVLGGLATRKESLKDIIQYYEEMPTNQKDSLFYHSLGCCYLVLGDFKKAEACFIAGIKLESNSAIHYEYGQALYLRKKYTEAIEQLKISIAKNKDNLLSYFSEMEKLTVIKELQDEIEKIGIVRAKSSHLANYLILNCFLRIGNINEFQLYFDKFKKLVNSNNNPFLQRLFNNISSQLPTKYQFS